MGSREIFNHQTSSKRSKRKEEGKKEDETFNDRPLPGALSISSKS